MFYEDFDFDEKDFRGCYFSDDLKITYVPTLHSAGIHEWIDTITHEWLHGLIDWALVGDEIAGFKDNHDETSNSDHFIMRLINYDEPNNNDKFIITLDES